MVPVLQFVEKMKLLALAFLLVYLTIGYCQFIVQLIEQHPGVFWDEVSSGLLGIGLIGLVRLVCRKCI